MNKKGNYPEKNETETTTMEKTSFDWGALESRPVGFGVYGGSAYADAYRDVMTGNNQGYYNWTRKMLEEGELLRQGRPFCEFVRRGNQEYGYDGRKNDVRVDRRRMVRLDSRGLIFRSGGGLFFLKIR